MLTKCWRSSEGQCQMGLTSTCSLQFTRKTGSETGGQEEPRLIHGAGGRRKLAVSLRRVLTPPLPRLFTTTSKSLSLLKRHPTLSPWVQAKTWPQGVEALTFYPSGKSGERAWTHVDTKTASGKGQGTSAQDQPQIREGEGVLRKAHPQGPSMKGLPKFKAHACLGHPRTPRVPPEANTDIGDKQ